MIRSIFICLALSLVSLSWSQAQATNDPYPIIYQHLYHARYPQAIALASATLDQYKSEPQSNNYATALALGGWVQQNMDKFRPADSLLSVALILYEKNGATADSNYLKTCAWLARVCSFTGKLQRADSILQKANAAAARCVGTPHTVHQATVLAQRFWLDIDRNKYQEASLKHAELIALLEKQWGKRHPRVAMTLVATTSSLETLTFLEQEASLLRAASILEKHQKRYPQEYASALSELANQYGEMSQFPKQLQSLLKAKDFLYQSLGTKHPQYANILRSLGGYYKYYTPTFKSAKALYQEALGIYADHFGEQSGAYISTLRSLSRWYGDLGRADSAAHLSDKAYSLTKLTYGEESYNAISFMLEAVSKISDEGKQLLADSLLNWADTLCRRANLSNSKLLIEILQERSGTQRWRGTYPQAKTYAEKAFQKQEVIYGPNSFLTTTGKLTLAFSYYLTENIQQSDSLFRLGLKDLQNIIGVESMLYAGWLELYSYVLVERSKLDSAKQCVEQSMSIKNRLGVNIVSGLGRMVSIQLAQRDYEGAEKTLEQNEILIKQMYGDTSKSMVDLLSNRLKFYKKTKTPVEQIALKRKIIVLQRTLGDAGQSALEMGLLALELVQAGEHNEAQQLHQEAIFNVEKLYGKTHLHYLLQLLLGVDLSIDIDDFTKAKSYLDEYEHLLKLTNAPNLMDLYLTAKTSYLRAIGNYREALITVENRLRQAKYNMKPSDYNVWAVSLLNIGSFAKADSLLQAGIKLAEKIGESTTYLYGNLAKAYAERGQYAQALAIYTITIPQILREDGYYSESMAIELKSLASCFNYMNRFKEAEDTLYRALSIFTELNNPLGQAETLRSLHVVHTEQDRLAIARSEILQALAITEKRLGPNHPRTLLYQRELAEHYRAEEQIGAADSLFNKIIAVREQKNNGSIEHADALLFYGNFLNKVTGEYDRALTMMEEGLIMIKKIFPSAHPSQTEFYKGIGEWYFNNKNYPRALEQYQNAAKIIESFYGKEHTKYASFQNLIGEALRNMYDLPNAEIAYRSALYIDSLKLGPAHFYNAIPLEGLMRVYELQGKYAQAEVLGERCLKIVEQSRGKKSGDYAKVAVRMASLLYRRNDYGGANALMALAKEVFHTQIKLQFSQIVPSRQINLFDQFANLDCFPSILEQHPNDSLASMCFDNTLLIQGAILDNTRSLRQAILATKDTSQLYLFDAYLAAQANLTDAEKNRSNQRDSLEALRLKLYQFEAALTQKSPAFHDYIKNYKSGWRDIQKKLKANEAAVMYLRYNRYRVSKSDSISYAAMIIRPEWNAPRFFPLVLESAFENLVADNSARGAADALTIYQHQGTYPIQPNIRGNDLKTAETVTFYQYLGTHEVKKPSVYEMIWKPLEAELEGANKIYFTPTGLLHRFNLGALPIKKKEDGTMERLQDIYQELVQMRSLRHLIQSKESGITTKASNRTALLVGKVDFGEFLNLSWKNLSDETPNCKYSLTQKQYKVNYLTSSSASAQNVLKTLQKGPSPSILHIATHGFFAPDLNKKTSRLSAASNPSKSPNTRDATSYLPKAWEPYPLMRSGLVLAGANNLDSTTLKAGKNPYILTAQDIAALNLKGTDLVILSACETGLGDVVNNEGVYGLQRAFLQAGAKQVIMSLWKVDDDKTRQFMGIFYENLLKGGTTPQQALRDTQEKMRWDNKTEKSPYEWAAFIIIE